MAAKNVFIKKTAIIGACMCVRGFLCVYARLHSPFVACMRQHVGTPFSARSRTLERLGALATFPCRLVTTPTPSFARLPRRDAGLGVSYLQ